MVEEQTGTDMIFEEQEKNSETQEIILGDPEGNLPEESNLDPEVQENAPHHPPWTPSGRRCSP
jgi:hypothetical protein